MSGSLLVVPKACVERLPLYYRALLTLEERGLGSVSSDELAQLSGVKAFQLRKDLSYFGEFGIRGFGYDIQALKAQLKEILGISRPWKVCIVGAGRLGLALAEYPGFLQHSLVVSAVFDSDIELIGKPWGDRGFVIQPVGELEKTVKDSNIRIGVITVPAVAAQSVAEVMVDAGIKGIWCFSPTMLSLPEDIRVHYEDLAAGLLGLSHYMSRGSAGKPGKMA